MHVFSNAIVPRRNDEGIKLKIKRAPKIGDWKGGGGSIVENIKTHGVSPCARISHGKLCQFLMQTPFRRANILQICCNSG